MWCRSASHIDFTNIRTNILSIFCQLVLEETQVVDIKDVAQFNTSNVTTLSKMHIFITDGLFYAPEIMWKYSHLCKFDETNTTEFRFTWIRVYTLDNSMFQQFYSNHSKSILSLVNGPLSGSDQCTELLVSIILKTKSKVPSRKIWNFKRAVWAGLNNRF